MRTLIFTLISLYLSVTTVIAQSDVCPPIIEQALSTVDDSCFTLERNHICYGNQHINGNWLLDDVPQFATPGDIAAIKGLERLELGGFDEISEQWGVAKLHLIANLPDTLPGQGVIFLIFGDVTIDDVSNDMQTFYFKSGIGQASCNNVPENGIVIQTPDGAGMVDFTINGVDISIGSTAFLTSPPTEGLSVQLLEGQIDVTANSVTQTMQPNEVVFVELDETQNPISPPSQPITVTDSIFDDAALDEDSALSSALSLEVSSTNRCFLTPLRNVNTRQGPSTNYRILGSATSSDNLEAVGKNDDWFILANGQWIAEFVVIAQGECLGLPFFDEPPLNTQYRDDDDFDNDADYDDLDENNEVPDDFDESIDEVDSDLDDDNENDDDNSGDEDD